MTVFLERFLTFFRQSNCLIQNVNVKQSSTLFLSLPPSCCKSSKITSLFRPPGVTDHATTLIAGTADFNSLRLFLVCHPVYVYINPHFITNQRIFANPNDSCTQKDGERNDAASKLWSLTNSWQDVVLLYISNLLVLVYTRVKDCNKHETKHEMQEQPHLTTVRALASTPMVRSVMLYWNVKFVLLGIGSWLCLQYDTIHLAIATMGALVTPQMRRFRWFCMVASLLPYV